MVEVDDQLLKFGNSVLEPALLGDQTCVLIFPLN